MPLSDMGGFPNVGGPTLVDPYGRPLTDSPRLVIPAFDPRNGTYFFDDFFGTAPTAAANAGNWSKTLNQAGTLSNGSGSTGNSQGAWTWTASGAVGSNYFSLSAGNEVFLPAGSIHEWRIKTPVSLSNATNQYYIAAGMSDTRFTTGSATNDISAIYTHTTTNAAWELSVKNSGVSTLFGGITPVQANTWYRLKIAFDNLGQTAALYANDVYQCTAIGIPNTALAIGAGHIAATTSNAEIVTFDYFYLQQRINRS